MDSMVTHIYTFRLYASQLEKFAANVLELLFTSEAVLGLCIASLDVICALILGWAFSGRLNRFCALGWTVTLGCLAKLPILFLAGLFAGWRPPPKLNLDGFSGFSFVFAGWRPPPKLNLDGLSGFPCVSVVFGRLSASSFCNLEFLNKNKQKKKEWT